MRILLVYHFYLVYSGMMAKIVPETLLNTTFTSFEPVT